MSSIFFDNIDTAEITRCVLYARVSDPKQVTQGSGITSQLRRCKEFAKLKGYTILDMFTDDGISGKECEQRVNMMEMIDYLREHSSEADPIGVIFDDITRLARDTRVHEDLRDAIFAAGAIPMTPSFKFGKDADSVMTEMVQATVAQHFRMKNAETTRNRLAARWADGYYTAKPPLGYKYELIKGRGKMLVPDPPLSNYVRDAIEGLACGRFTSATEVMRYFESKPDYPRPKSGNIRLQTVIDIIERSTYAGFLCVKSKGIHMRPAQHEALVDVETWEKAKAQLAGRSFVAARKPEIAEGFPLRGHINCACCGGVLTGGWSKGKRKKYPYYVCQQKGCAMRNKSIRRDQLESDFGALVRDLQPTQGLFDMAQDMLRQFWEARIADGQTRRKKLAAELRGIEQQIENVMERLFATKAPELVEAYESEVSKLSRKKARLQEQSGQYSNAALEHRKSFDEIFEKVWTFLSNPWVLWEKGNHHHKQLLMRMVFTEKLSYCRDNGFLGSLNTKIALPFSALAPACANNVDMVPLT